ncbi:sensor histidine kinase [Nocardia iowensis]|uniref:histidine kinase n=1 Tax=Nocardia iowensis TaxID=204891 RepID=A0ABX8RYT5_NOCIO|nr:sensor histidine kinase [Nocardia iowensis]QXN94818.1 sensor histidine kinase [Nocardia iowensis]
MNQDIAVVLSWILAAALVVAIAVALYAVQYARQQRARAEALGNEQRAAEEAVERFATTTIPAVAESIRRFDGKAPTVEMPPALENSRLAQVLRWIAERYADDLSLLRSETREQANHEAQQAIKAAEDAVRTEVSTASRQATSAAVRSFGTSVVSLGADVSQVVSAALREHRKDEVYETLTRIDHTVQQMIRQAQSYVIVCGGLPGRRWPAQSLTDVVGGAVGRVRDYLRVRPNQLDRVVISRAVEPLVHTLATLLDNALRYSPPTSFVDVSFQEGHHGVTVIIDDAGVRMNAEQMEEARQVLAHERSVDIHQLGPSPKVGFPGIAALARRYGFTVYIDGPNVYGGMRAMVYIPEALLMTPQPGQEVAPSREIVAEPTPAPAPVSEPQSEEPSESEAFAVHEITSGGLPKRRRRTVALAPVGPRTEPGLARPDIAAAWHNGSKSGRAAASDQSDHTEGMTS